MTGINEVLKRLQFEIEELPHYDVTVSEESTLGVVITRVHNGDFLSRAEVLDLIRNYVRRTEGI